ncbi:MAG: hypothetical protein SPG53_01690, partial [Prevotella sp.]|nr:hypothetical protein [Prevotella sp.]
GISLFTVPQMYMSEAIRSKGLRINRKCRMEETACLTIRDTAWSFPLFMHAEIVTMTELPVAIIFDNVKLALALIRLSLNVRLVNGELFI